MPIGTAQDLMVGETVIAIGNAYGYEQSVSLGIVSAIKRDVSLNKDMAYKGLIQTDAAINPGNSGGPLLNINGELVGVNVAIRAGAQCIGFAIPADQMVRTVTEMLHNRRRAMTYDGLLCKDVLEPSDDGPVRKVLVERVDANSPAFAAGIKAGDIVVQAGGVKIATGIDVERALLERKVGETVPFVVRRDGEEKKLEIVLASADRAIQTVATVDVVWQKLGVQLAPVAPESVTRFNNELRGGMEVTAHQRQRRGRQGRHPQGRHPRRLATVRNRVHRQCHLRTESSRAGEPGVRAVLHPAQRPGSPGQAGDAVSG